MAGQSTSHLLAIIAFVLLGAGLFIFIGGEGDILHQYGLCKNNSNSRDCGVGISTMILGFVAWVCYLITAFKPLSVLEYIALGPYIVATAFMGYYVVTYGGAIDASNNHAPSNVNAAFTGSLIWFVGVLFRGLYTIMPREV